MTLEAKIKLIKKAYSDFNARDIDGVLAVMAPDVKWTKAWEGDYARGHQEVRKYWERQWKEVNPIVNPVGFRERENGSFEVEVEQLVKDMADQVLFEGKVKHVYLIKDGLLTRMDVETY